MIENLLGEHYGEIVTFCLFSVGFLITICLSLVFSKKIPKLIYPLAVVVGLFYKQINNLIFELYKSYNANNQVSTVLIMIALSIILIGLVSIKKTRSFDRIFGAIMVSSVTAIWILVHTTMIYINLVQGTKEVVALHERSISIFLKNNDKGSYYDYCKAHNLSCSWGGDTVNKDFVKKFMEYGIKDQPSFKNFEHKTATNPNNYENILSKNYISFSTHEKEHAFVYQNTKDGKRYTSTIIAKAVQKIHTQTKYYFYAWFDIALITWLWGGLGLLFFHKRMFAKKAKRNLEAQIAKI